LPLWVRRLWAGLRLGLGLTLNVNLSYIAIADFELSGMTDPAWDGELVAFR